VQTLCGKTLSSRLASTNLNAITAVEITASPDMSRCNSGDEFSSRPSPNRIFAKLTGNYPLAILAPGDILKEHINEEITRFKDVGVSHPGLGGGEL
jgi:hypothetical protein